MLSQTVIRYMTLEERKQEIRKRVTWIMNCEQLLQDIAEGKVVKTYQIGSRSVTRRDISVPELEDLIEKFTDDIAALDTTGTERNRYMGRFLCEDD